MDADDRLTAAQRLHARMDRKGRDAAVAVHAILESGASDARRLEHIREVIDAWHAEDGRMWDEAGALLKAASQGEASDGR